MIQRHGQFILCHKLLDLKKCFLLLIGIHGCVGCCNHLIQAILLGNRGVVGCSGCKAVIELTLCQGCNGCIGQIPLHSGRSLLLVCGRYPKLGCQVAFQLPELGLHANLLPVLADNGHQIHGLLVIIVVDHVQGIVCRPSCFLQQLLGLFRIILIDRDLRVQPVAGGGKALSHFRLSLKKAVHNGFHVNGVGQCLPHPYIRQRCSQICCPCPVCGAA